MNLGENLCLACGLCCDGTLFDNVQLGLGEDAKDQFHVAQAGEVFEPDIDPAQMAAYLSLYATN